jgi:hypothetical protein
MYSFAVNITERNRIEIEGIANNSMESEIVSEMKD